jgi:hypothetical protein
MQKGSVDFFEKHLTVFYMIKKAGSKNTFHPDDPSNVLDQFGLQSSNIGLTDHSNLTPYFYPDDVALTLRSGLDAKKGSSMSGINSSSHTKVWGLIDISHFTL